MPGLRGRETRAGSSLRVPDHLCTRVEQLFRLPVALNERENSPKVVVRELAAERRHVAFVAGRRVLGGHAILGNAKEHIVGVMPCVPALVMRRGRHAPAGKLLSPVRLAFELRAGANGAVLRVYLCAERNLRRIARIRSALPGTPIGA